MNRVEQDEELRRAMRAAGWAAVAEAWNQPPGSEAAPVQPLKNKGWHHKDSMDSANAVAAPPGSFVATARDQSLKTGHVEKDTIAPACRIKSDWNEFLGVRGPVAAPQHSAQAVVTEPTMKKAKVVMEQLQAMAMPTTVSVNPPQKLVTAGISVGAIKETASQVIQEVKDWTAYLWNMISGGSSAKQGEGDSQDINGRNPDGSVNPFAAIHHALTPEERRRFEKATVEMSKLFDRLYDLLSEDQFEAIMFLIVKESIEARKDGGNLIKSQMIDAYREKAKLSKESLKEAEKLRRAIQNKSWFKEFEEVATTLGLMTAAALSMGSGGWSVVALVYVAGTAYNRYQGHLAEKAVAKGIAWTGSKVFGYNKGPLEASLSETLRVGTGVVNGAIAVSLGGFSHWLGVMMQGTMQIVNVKAKMDYDSAMGRDIEHGEKRRKVTKRVSGQFKAQTDNLERQANDQKLAGSILRMYSEAAKSLVKF